MSVKRIAVVDGRKGIDSCGGRVERDHQTDIANDATCLDYQLAAIYTHTHAFIHKYIIHTVRLLYVLRYSIIHYVYITRRTCNRCNIVICSSLNLYCDIYPRRPRGKKNKIYDKRLQ